MEFIIIHVTTSSDNCEYIAQNGLRDLVSTYMDTNTELRQFLIRNDIIIQLSNKKMIVEGKEYSLLSDACKIIKVKFFSDAEVCGCFQINPKRLHAGNVHRRPEIIFNLNKFVKKDLEKIWENEHKCYFVKVKIPFNKIYIGFKSTLIRTISNC